MRAIWPPNDKYDFFQDANVRLNLSIIGSQKNEQITAKYRMVY